MLPDRTRLSIAEMLDHGFTGHAIARQHRVSRNTVLFIARQILAGKFRLKGGKPIHPSPEHPMRCNPCGRLMAREVCVCGSRDWREPARAGRMSGCLPRRGWSEFGDHGKGIGDMNSLQIEGVGEFGLGWKPDLPGGHPRLTFSLDAVKALPPSNSRFAEFLPEIWNQGHLGSCTAHGILRGSITPLPRPASRSQCSRG